MALCCPSACECSFPVGQLSLIRRSGAASLSGCRVTACRLVFRTVRRTVFMLPDKGVSHEKGNQILNLSRIGCSGGRLPGAFTTSIQGPLPKESVPERRV